MQMNAVRTLTVRGQSQGLDRVTSDLGKVSAAQERVSQTSEGMARTTETSARRQLSAGRDFQRLMERNDRLVYLQTQLAKEMGTVNRAYEQGAIEARQHAQAVQMVEGKYRNLIAVEQQARASASAQIASNDNVAQSLHRVAAANDNVRGSTANVAAQFQDIGVTAAMGMSPIMIALQQGTQLSSVLMTMQSPLKGLAGAFMSLLNPVSLLTIGFVALAAVAIQWFSSAAAGAEDAETALETHRKLLDDILAGYEQARQAAQDYLDTASRSPEGATMSQLLTQRDDSAEKVRAGLAAIAEEQDRVRASFGDLAYAGDTATLSMVEGLENLGLSAASTNAEVDAVITRLTQMANDDSLSDKARKYARDLLPFIENLAQARAEVGSLDTAIRNLPRDIQIRLNISQEFSGAVGAIGDLYVDPRSQFEVARENLENWTAQATATAQSYGDLVGVGNEYTRVLASINAAEAEAAEKKGASGVKAAEKLRDAYADLITEGHRFIAEQEMEREALGQTEEQANALRYAQDLLNQAMDAGVTLTPEKTKELTALGHAMAAAEAETARLTKAYEDQQKAFDDVMGVVGETLSSLFDGPMDNMDAFFDKLIGRLAGLGQANLDSVFKNLFSTDGMTGATGGAEGGTSFWDQIGGILGQNVKQGAADGTQQGAMQGLKGLAGLAGAGLGGFGIGAQTQSPLMGALGGALAGMSAGPIGAVIGGIAGFIGGLFGMNQALQKNKEELDKNRAAIEQFISTALGDSVSQYTKMLEDARSKAQSMIELARAAQDWDLAGRIQAALDQLPATLAREFTKDLQSSLNELEGNSWLNDVAAAQKQYNDNLADAATLGVDASMALRVFELTLKKIATEGDLTTEQMAEFAAMFPDIAAGLDAVTSIDIGQLEANVERARSALTAAYQKERSTLEGVINTWKQISAQMRDFRNGLRLNDAVSPLSPFDKFSEAQRQFNEVSAKALAGDQQAMGDLTNVSQEYLDAARGYYASSEQYFAIFESVEAILDQALSKADTQVSAAEQQIALLDRQVAGLIDINESVLSVAEAVRQLQMAQGELSNANGFDASTYWSQDLKAMYAQTKAYKEETGASSIPIAGFWNELYSATSAGMMDEIARKLAAEVAALPRYADGTNFHPGGMAWVGERGPEIVNLPRGSQVMPNFMSMPFAANSNGGDMSALISAFRSEIGALRQEVARLTDVSAMGAKANVDATGSVRSKISSGNRESDLRQSRGKAA